MTLNGVMALPLRYFNKFGKPAFQLLTASSNIELITKIAKFDPHRFKIPKPIAKKIGMGD